jgi:L-fuconolactonase
MRIDAHQHFWRVARGDYFWLTPELKPLYRDFGPEDLEPLLDAGGIDATVTVQAAATIAESRFMLEVAAGWDRVAGVVGWVDFESPSAPDDLADLAENPKLVGIRPMIQDIPDDDWMLRPDLDPAFIATAEQGIVFDALVFPRHLKNLLKRLEQHPDLRVVVDHCAKPQIKDGGFEPWATDIARIARETAAWCKISGIVTEAGPGWTVDGLRPYVEHVISVFGPDRIVWGSDWPVVTLASTYGAWLQAAETLASGLTESERAALFGGNAIALYRLDAPGRLNTVASPRAASAHTAPGHRHSPRTAGAGDTSRTDKNV